MKSKEKGKSGGARADTHLHITDCVVFLLYIHDKSDQDSIPDKESIALIKDL